LKILCRKGGDTIFARLELERRDAGARKFIAKNIPMFGGVRLGENSSEEGRSTHRW